VSGYLHGFHDPGGERLMEDAPGWVLFTEKLGADPSNRQGPDYSPIVNRGFRVIARLNHGYGKEGTIPSPEWHDEFAKRCGGFVGGSWGCHIWIVGNEPNHPQEWPGGNVILPPEYAVCYMLAEREIHKQPGHENDVVIPAPIAPWCGMAQYPGNERGDWIKYFFDVLKAILDYGGRIDGIGLHTYTHGHDANLVYNMDRMGPPFEDRLFNFRSYRDFLDAVPQALRHLPAYITEFNPTGGWVDVNNGYVMGAYEEVAAWNADPAHQQIRSLILYRWWNVDRWQIEHKPGVHGDFQAAVRRRFQWVEGERPPPPPPPPEGVSEAWVKEYVAGELEAFRQDLAGRIGG
jgi:hypothetical protein